MVVWGSYENWEFGMLGHDRLLSNYHHVNESFLLVLRGLNRSIMMNGVYESTKRCLPFDLIVVLFCEMEETLI